MQESIADQFVVMLKKKAMAMKVGCAYDPETKLGPVVSEKHRRSICDWIQRGIDEGAKLVLDGRGVTVPGYEGGYFIGPTILDHVTPEMVVGQREIFGPVTLVKRVKSFEEGLAVMNANPFANGSASTWGSLFPLLISHSPEIRIPSLATSTCWDWMASGSIPVPKP